MSELASLRRLLSMGVGATQTGLVTEVGPTGAVHVLIGSRVLSCTTTVPVKAGERVRVQGFVILARIDQIVKDVPVFRV